MPPRNATQGQIGFIANLLDQMPKDDQFAEDVRDVLHDPTHVPTFAWAKEMIDELKAHLADERYNEQPVEKGRLAPVQRLNETPAERIKRIYRCHWRLKDLSLEGFDKRWAEVGEHVLEFHGVTV